MADADPVASVAAWAWKQKAGFWVKLAAMLAAIVFGSQSADVVRAAVAKTAGLELPEDSATAERQHNLLRIEADTKIEKLGQDMAHRFDRLDARIDELLLRGRR